MKALKCSILARPKAGSVRAFNVMKCLKCEGLVFGCADAYCYRGVGCDARSLCEGHYFESDQFNDYCAGIRRVGGEVTVEAW